MSKELAHRGKARADDGEHGLNNGPRNEINIVLWFFWLANSKTSFGNQELACGVCCVSVDDKVS